MKKSWKKLVTTVTLFAFFAFLPISCGLLCRDSCGCGPLPKIQEFVINSIEVKTIDGSKREIQATEKKPYNQIFKVIEFNDIEFTSEINDEGSIMSNMGIAFACDPAPPTSQNKLQLIQIINQENFTLAEGSEYRAGENLNALFGVNRFFNSELESFEGFIESGRKLNLYEELFLGLLDNPEKELNLKVTIRLLFDDGQEFLLTDQILNIQ